MCVATSKHYYLKFFSFFLFKICQIQCNVFEGTSSDVALTAAGGLRQLSGLSEGFESPSLVCNSNLLIFFYLDT